MEKKNKYFKKSSRNSHIMSALSGPINFTIWAIFCPSWNHHNDTVSRAINYKELAISSAINSQKVLIHFWDHKLQKWSSYGAINIQKGWQILKVTHNTLRNLPPPLSDDVIYERSLCTISKVAWQFPQHKHSLVTFSVILKAQTNSHLIFYYWHLPVCVYGNLGSM